MPDLTISQANLAFLLACCLIAAVSTVWALWARYQAEVRRREARVRAHYDAARGWRP